MVFLFLAPDKKEVKKMGCTHGPRDGIIKDLSQIDASLLDFQGDEEDKADDGPNTGDAGEQEAVMAEEESAQDPRRAHVRDLVDRLIQAIPSMTPTEALEWLEGDMRRANPNWAGKLKLGQFASDELAQAVDVFIETFALATAADTGDDNDPTAFMEAALAHEADDAEAELADDESVTDEDGDELPADEDVSTDASDVPAANQPTDASDGLEPWKQQLLELLVPARRARTHDTQIDAADKLAKLVHQTAFAIYRERGLPDEVIAPRLAQRRNGTVVTVEDCEDDVEAHRETWYFRTAFWMVSSAKDPVDLLREFELPVLRRPKSQRPSVDDAQTEPPAVADDSTDAASQDADRQPENGTAVSDRAGQADVEPASGDAGDRFVVSSDGVASDVERQIVDSHGLSERRGDKDRLADKMSRKPKAEEGQGDTAAATGDKPKAGPPPPTDRSTSGGDAERRPKSDEAILANLPDDVIEAAIRAVLEDDDPVECWAYRSPESIRKKADDRLLLEYGQPAVA